jgi:DNA repair protein RecN (Recombination protein N)
MSGVIIPSALLAADDIPAEDELILRRVQFADGRTRAFVNDQPVSVQVLKQLGGALVEIHGQHDERALIDTGTHRRLLDAFGAHEEPAANVAALWDARRQAQAVGGAPRGRARQRERLLRHAVAESISLPASWRRDRVADRRTAMMQAEKVAEDLRSARDVIAGTESACRAFRGIRRLERRATALTGSSRQSRHSMLH